MRMLLASFLAHQALFLKPLVQTCIHPLLSGAFDTEPSVKEQQTVFRETVFSYQILESIMGNNKFLCSEITAKIQLSTEEEKNNKTDKFLETPHLIVLQCSRARNSAITSSRQQSMASAHSRYTF